MAYTKLNTRVDRFQCDPTYALGSVTATAVPLTAFLQTKLLVNDADPTDIVAAPVKPLSFDLLALSSVTAAGKTVTGPQLAALIRQACLDEANRQQVT